MGPKATRNRTGSILDNIGDIHEGTRYRIKDSEKAKVFHEICRAAGTTRTSIIRLLNLRPTSVSHVVNELVRDSLVVERHTENNGRQGRPEISLFPNRDRFLSIAVYIASRTLKAALINAFEEILVSIEVPIDEQVTNREFIGKFASVVNSLRERIPAGSEFLGVGLSIPGFIDMAKQQWIFTARWPSIRKLKFDDLRKATGAPIFVTRVLDAGLEYILSQTREFQDVDVSLIHWGYGIGAAYANAGKIMSSNIGGVCEVGHWKVPSPKAKPCKCGSSGCLETESSLWAITPSLKKNFPDVPEEEEFFAEYLKAHGEMAEHPAVRNAIEGMSKGIGMLFITLFPRHILVYGPFCVNKGIRDLLTEQVSELIPGFARSYFSIDFLDTAGYRGEIYGTTRPLFREAYRKHLIASGG
jgi:predicted NBD/HSP70 family sugar kinase